jgi:hypothetical protein
VTATRDRQSDLDEPPVDPGWDQRPIFGASRGLPWWAAVLLAFFMASVAAWIDFQRQSTLGRIYQVGYILGCLIAVCWVRRRNLFGPMVQPPLVFAVTAVGGVILNQPGAPLSSGMRQLLLDVALPLTSNFPTMAITTGVTLVIGVFRLWRQRDPNPRIMSNRRARDLDRFAEPVEPLDERDPRATRLSEPPAGRPPRDRGRPDRGGSRTGRARVEQEPPPERERRRPGRTGERPERADRGERGERRNPPPRSGRGRGEPPADRDRDRGRADRGRGGSDRQDRDRRRDQGGQQPPRRQPRRRPPDGDHR